MLIYQTVITAILALLLLNTINNLRFLRAPGAPSPQENGERSHSSPCSCPRVMRRARLRNLSNRSYVRTIRAVKFSCSMIRARMRLRQSSRTWRAAITTYGCCMARRCLLTGTESLRLLPTGPGGAWRMAALCGRRYSTCAAVCLGRATAGARATRRPADHDAHHVGRKLWRGVAPAHRPADICHMPATGSGRESPVAALRRRIRAISAFPPRDLSADWWTFRGSYGYRGS